MPKYRNILIQLHSDTADAILELAPPTEARHSPTKCLTPLLQDDCKAQISVYIPITPKALFWISYRIEPPPTDDSFFVFKLFVNRQHIVTWSCDARNKFKGKTMFGLFDTSGEEGGQHMQKRVFQFGAANGSRVVGDLTSGKEEDRFLEIRVFRANKKKRIPPITQRTIPNTGPGMELVNGGQLKPQAPQRYYRFGLIDPIDTPYATFRFYYRTWEEIDALGLRMGQVEGDGGSLFADAIDSPETTILDPIGQAIASNGRFNGTPSSTLRNSPSNASISGDYFSSYSAASNLPEVVYSAQPHSPGASFSDQRANPRHHASPMPMTYAPQQGTPPRAHPPFPHLNPMYNGGQYPTTGAAQYGSFQEPHQAASESQLVQNSSNFSVPLKRLSIPPQLLLQPLLSKRALPPSPLKLEQRQMEAREGTVSCGSFAEREALAKKVLEARLDNLQAPSLKIPGTRLSDIAETPRGHLPKELSKNKSDQKGSLRGRLFGRLHSKERENSEIDA